MKQHTWLATSVAVVVGLFVLVAPSLALAAGQPGLSPMTVFSENFEGAAPPLRLTLDWITTFDDLTGLPVPPPAYWGRITASGHSHSTTHGLWCAGARPDVRWTTGSAATAGAWSVSTAWADFSYKYPAFTAGLATFEVPELKDYYSAALSYQYLMPSIGSNDYDTFNVKWRVAGEGSWDTNNSQAAATVWTGKSYALTAPSTGGNSIDLSRTGGEVCFQFYELAGDYPFEGPTIDDVSVTGYKYGPVRNLAAAVDPSGVHLSWRVPARSAAASAPDEDRTITYRVWRASGAQPDVWVELTTARLTSTTFDDAASLDGVSSYIVQAWDPAVVGDGYGELAVAAHATVIPSVPVSTITVTGGTPADGVYTAMPTVTVSRDTARGTTYYRWGDYGGYASSALTSFEVPALEGTHTLEVYSVNTLNVAETPHVLKAIVVAVASPGPPPVSTIVVSGTPGAGGAYTTTPTITVSRNQGDGTTYYSWDSGASIATSSASFRLPALPGLHALKVYSVSATGVGEQPTVSRTLIVSVPAAKMKPALSTPTLSTSYVHHKRTFYIRGTLKSAHASATTLKVYAYRYYRRAYHLYKTYTVTLAARATSYSVKTSLGTTGTYRVRAYHSCALHIATYSAYRKFTVHR
jgi:hypothetical protein